jgi:hypothetical protein
MTENQSWPCRKYEEFARILVERTTPVGRYYLELVGSLPSNAHFFFSEAVCPSIY